LLQLIKSLKVKNKYSLIMTKVYDDYKTGLHDDDSPMNQKESLSEMEEVNILVEQLENRLKQSNERSRYLSGLLKKLAGIRQMKSITGKQTESEEKEIDEILEPYLNKQS